MSCTQNSSEKMLIILSVLLFTTNCWANQPSIASRIDPTTDPNIAEDAKLTTPQLITKYGYNAEVHFVTTKDGYILQMHRISGGKKYPTKQGKKVCFLMHGLLDSSATWVLSGPGHGLGYILADDNNDVWMGNNRGNRYSANHTTLYPFGTKSDRKKFWSFSWHKIGMFDVPTMIDYVLAKTEQTKLQYIGHSQGTTAFFVMTSQRPEYNDKIEMMHAMAPVAFFSNVISPPVRIIAPFVSMEERMSSLIGLDDVMTSNEYLQLAGREMCRDKVRTQIICENVFFLMMGYESDQLNSTLLPVILSNVPAGASSGQLLHYLQEVNSAHFRQYDHGLIGNLVHYKRISPPDYNLNNVKAPIALYYSQNDWVAVVKDVQRLKKSLPNVVKDYLVPHKQFNHIDFTWGIDAPSLVYDEIIRTMK